MKFFQYEKHLICCFDTGNKNDRLLSDIYHAEENLKKGILFCVIAPIFSTSKEFDDKHKYHAAITLIDNEDREPFIELQLNENEMIEGNILPSYQHVLLVKQYDGDNLLDKDIRKKIKEDIKEYFSSTGNSIKFE